MGRSGYSDDCDNVAMWRGTVASSIRGRRGQVFLRELLTALDAMTEKRLIPDELELSGEVCAIGALGRQRGVDMSKMDPNDGDQVAAAFDIARHLALEVVYMNDEVGRWQTPEQRWQRMRGWVAAQIKQALVSA